MEKLMNEENEWDHSILTTVKERPADCIRIVYVLLIYYVLPVFVNKT